MNTPASAEDSFIDKHAVYSQVQQTKPKDASIPSFMKKGMTTTITLGSEKFTVVDPTVIEGLRRQVQVLQSANTELKETSRMQDLKIKELTQAINKQNQKINTIVNEMNRNNWRNS